MGKHGPDGRVVQYNEGGMSLDIGKILGDWPYEPGQVSVRKIRGEDGREKIQLRLDLGILQMETTGRPDGQRPHGCESLLAYHARRLARYRKAHGGDGEFRLDADACEHLRTEAVMYYHRYLAEFVLEDYAAVERDTARNLEVLEVLKRYAAEESDREAMEPYRPYILMMQTRARSQRQMRQKRLGPALRAVREGISGITDFYRGIGHEEMIGKSGEIEVLQTLAKEIESLIPEDPIRRLRKDLEKAVREERYEDAARLRDELHRLAPNHRD